MTFKPMKGDDADLSRLVFPYMVTPKLDGHRCLIVNGVAMTSAMKPFPNKHIQAFFASGKWDGLDGELVVGPPNHPDVFKRTSSGVRRVEGEPGFTFWAFDIWDDALVDAAGKRVDFVPAADRYEAISRVFDVSGKVKQIPMSMVRSSAELDVVEARYVERGYEGVMLRGPNSPYKHGRATVRENYLLKLKRFCDAEAGIVGFVEQMQNTNEKKTNALGRSQRSSAKAGKVGKGTLGALVVRALNGKYAGVEFEVGTGFDDALRREIWLGTARFSGQVITFKYQDVGGYDKPRIPVFKGFRDPAET